MSKLKNIFKNFTGSQKDLDTFNDFFKEYSYSNKSSDDLVVIYQNKKQEFLSDLFPDGKSGFSVVLNSNTITNQERIQYKRILLNSILSSYSFSFKELEYQNKKQGFYNLSNISQELLTDEELQQGYTNKEIKYKGKRFGKGAKITRVTNALEIDTHESGRKTNLFNNLDIDVEREFLFTIHPAAILYAGKIGNSCLSPDGVNAYALANYAFLPQVMTVFSGDLKWRTLVYLDPDRKLFYIGSGYPYKRTEYLFLIKNHLESKGYQLTQFFQYYGELYFSDDTCFDGSFCKDPTLTVYIETPDCYEAYQGLDTITGKQSYEGEPVPFYFLYQYGEYTLNPELECYNSTIDSSIIDSGFEYYSDVLDGYIDIRKVSEYHYLINQALFRENQSRTEEDQSKKHFAFSEMFNDTFYIDALYEPYTKAEYYLVNLKQEEIDDIFFDVIEDL